MSQANSGGWRRRARTISLLVFCVMTGGCGLKDYESHIDEEHVNLEQFDEMNKVLTAPLEMPLKFSGDKVKIQSDGFGFKFFLRPPRWITTKATEKDGPWTAGERKGKEDEKDASLAHVISLYRYPGTSQGYNLLYSEFGSDVDLKGQHTLNGLPPREFRHRVRTALEDYVEKTFKETVKWAAEDRVEKLSLSITEKAQPVILEYERQRFANMPAEAKDDPRFRSFDLYFRQDGQYQAAVIYQLPGAAIQDPEVKKAVDFSLKTLSFAQPAVEKMMEFSQRKKPRK